jgi:hypothetical protein
MIMNKTSKYWICDSCAKEKNLIFPKWPGTCTSGRCAHCNSKEEVSLTPVCDFEDPKSGRKPVWD